jgi:anti-sigma factor RsiW
VLRWAHEPRRHARHAHADASRSGIHTGGEESGEGAPVPSSTKGYNLVSWRENGISYWAISDLAIGELQAFVRLFKSA